MDNLPLSFMDPGGMGGSRIPMPLMEPNGMLQGGAGGGGRGASRIPIMQQHHHHQEVGPALLNDLPPLLSASAFRFCADFHHCRLFAVMVFSTWFNYVRTAQPQWDPAGGSPAPPLWRLHGWSYGVPHASGAHAPKRRRRRPPRRSLPCLPSQGGPPILPRAPQGGGGPPFAPPPLGHAGPEGGGGTICHQVLYAGAPSQRRYAGKG